MAAHRATWIAFSSIVRANVASSRAARASKQLILSKSSPTPHGLQCFHSSCILPQERDGEGKAFRDAKETKPTPKRKAARTQASSTSLRRVALEAQSSRKLIKGRGRSKRVDPDTETKDVTAYCAAETYNIHVARHVLKQEGFEPDPFNTDLYPQVLHVQTPNYVTKNAETGEEKAQGAGDVFVFPSGCAVTWNVPERLAHNIVERLLPRAAEHGHPDKMEIEDLEYVEDASREKSMIVGDTIILGTAASSDHNTTETSSHSEGRDHIHGYEADTVLAKIAFSSALARSTKLAVLETQLSHYFHTTRSIPTTLSAGSRLHHTRRFILQKTGELLNIRAQLNLYSELTDSLPDLFWDSPHELGLESYYEQVGRALDVGVRIKVLNERMDYASEIAAVLRERLSEKHSTELEWLIIGLISIEVGFEILRLWKERQEKNDPESTEVLFREWLQRQLAKQ